MASHPDSRLIKVLGGGLFALGAAIAVVPQFTQCDGAMAMCLSTAKWEIAVGAAVMALAVLVIVARQRVRQAAAVGAGALAMLSIALPTAITGLCADPMMRCQMYLRPSIIVLGVITLALSVGVLGVAAFARRPAGESDRPAA